MADYKQTGIAGSKWHRFGRIVIDNPRTAAPSVLCVEQEVIALADNEIVREVGNLSFPFDPNLQFEIIDPVSNTGTGQFASGGAVYALVYSYVMHMATERDRAAVAAAEAEAERLAGLAAATAVHNAAP